MMKRMGKESEREMTKIKCEYCGGDSYVIDNIYFLGQQEVTLYCPKCDIKQEIEINLEILNRIK